jgi:hypothetical protein
VCVNRNRMSNWALPRTNSNTVWTLCLIIIAGVSLLCCNCVRRWVCYGTMQHDRAELMLSYILSGTTTTTKTTAIRAKTVSTATRTKSSHVNHLVHFAYAQSCSEQQTLCAHYGLLHDAFLLVMCLYDPSNTEVNCSIAVSTQHTE